MSEPSGPPAAAAAATDETVRSADFSATGARFPAWAVPGGHLLLLGHCLRGLRLLANPMVRLVFQRQVYFIGVRGLPVITLLAFATGALMVTQATSVLGSGNSYLYIMLVWTLVTEAAPLFVAIVVIGRSATVISTELALMKVRGEMRHLEHMQIDPRDYLALPRIAAFTVSLLAATFFYQVVSVTGGFAVSTLLLNVSFREQMHLMLAAISPLAFVLAGAKTFVFGVVIGTIACFAGIYAGDTINDVPRAQIVAYLRSLTWLVVLDLLFAIATFGTFA
jgi:phospholipid/cholesterol/gamma-HCH transport system permease protein